MSKKDKIKNIDMDDLKALPDVLDGRHHVIPIVTGGDEVLEEVNVPEILPILTLRSSVLFPGAITPITVGREKSIRLVREVNERNGLLGAVLQRESEVEDRRRTICTRSALRLVLSRFWRCPTAT